MRQGLSRRLLLLVFALIAIIAVIVIVTRPGKGRIVVSSPYSDASITITNESRETVKIGQRNLQLSVPTGSYTIAVQSKTISVRKLVVVESGKTVEYVVSAPVGIIPEPVTSGVVRDLAIDQTHLSYFDSGQHQISVIDSSGTITNLGSGDYNRIEWADSQYGVAQNSQGQLYVIQNSATHALQLPSFIDKNAPVSFAVTPDRKIYLVSGKNVYLGDELSGFKQIYTTSIATPAVFAGKDRFAIIGTKTSGGEHAEITAELAIITNSGKLIKKISGSASDGISSPLSAAWSPNGDLLSVTNFNQVSSVFNNKLEKLTDLPTENVSSQVWQDDNHLFLGDDSDIWLYDVKSGASSIVSSITDGSTVNELAESAEKDYIYVTTSKDSDSGTVYRLGLRGQQPSKAGATLGVFLPESLSACYVNYINLVQPIVILHPYGNSLVDSCKQSVIGSLQDAQINLGQVPVVVGEILQQSD